MIENSNQENKPSGLFNLKMFKKHLSTILFAVLMAVLLFSPDAKSFLIKQLMFTGLFDAEIYLIIPQTMLSAIILILEIMKALK